MREARTQTTAAEEYLVTGIVSSLSQQQRSDGPQTTEDAARSSITIFPPDQACTMRL